MIAANYGVRYPVRAMTKFDLQKTQEVVDLLAIDPSARDQTWLTSFYAAIPNASMESQEPQVILGPDNQAYFVLKTPKGGSFSPFSITHILDVCLQQGFGIVLNPQKGTPDFVFSYGQLWHFKETGELAELPLATGMPDDNLDGQILIASPSERIFPQYARSVLAKVLQTLNVAAPAIMMITDARGQRRLVFNFFPEDCTSDKDFATKMGFLNWYLPNSHGLTAISKKSNLAKDFRSIEV